MFNCLLGIQFWASHSLFASQVSFRSCQTGSPARIEDSQSEVFAPQSTLETLWELKLALDFYPYPLTPRALLFTVLLCPAHKSHSHTRNTFHNG